MLKALWATAILLLGQQKAVVINEDGKVCNASTGECRIVVAGEDDGQHQVRIVKPGGAAVGSEQDGVQCWTTDDGQKCIVVRVGDEDEKAAAGQQKIVVHKIDKDGTGKVGVSVHGGAATCDAECIAKCIAECMASCAGAGQSDGEHDVIILKDGDGKVTGQKRIVIPRGAARAGAKSADPEKEITLHVVAGDDDDDADDARTAQVWVSAGEPQIKAFKGGQAGCCPDACCKAGACCQTKKAPAGKPQMFFTPAGKGKVLKLNALPGGLLEIPHQALQLGGVAAPHALSPVSILSSEDDDPQSVQTAPDAYIGVRVAPVPGALAAHLGDKGVMVANVVEGSPADEAGLERHDIIVSVDGEAINDGNDLISAIGEAGVGATLKMGVIQHGKSNTLKLKTARRPDGEAKFKYEEAEDAIVDNSVQFRGKALRMGPDGQWLLEDLGDLKELPDKLKLWVDEKGLFDPKDFKFDLDLKMSPDDEHTMIITPDDADGGKAKMRVEVRVESDQDGNCITVNRGGDGKITVKRKTADGNESEKTYDSMKALAEDDDEAHRMLEKSGVWAGGGGRKFILQHPSGEELGEWRTRWQEQIEKHLNEAQQQIESNMKQGREQIRRELEKARESIEGTRAKLREKRGEKKSQEQSEKRSKEESAKRSAARAEWRAAAGGGASAGGSGGASADSSGAATVNPAASAVAVEKHDDGSITVTTQTDGRNVRRTFESAAEMKKADPELYERIHGLLE
ncbi:MAG: hypothetical protein CHACPFDD_01899 [Phycisphaerae bacterium]|nr:hypothetical protein [Phycisphaerae bacterium]